MAIEIKEYVGAGNISVVNEQAMLSNKKRTLKKAAGMKGTKRSVKSK